MGRQFLAERVFGNKNSPAYVKLLTEGVKGLIGAWRLGVLNQEYKRLKKIKEEND